MESVTENIVEKEEFNFKPYTLKQHVPKNSPIPKGRSGHRIVSDNSCLYSFGGFNPCMDFVEIFRTALGDDHRIIKELWKFNIAKGEWIKLEHYTQSLPKQLASNCVLMKGSFLIVHGGTGLPFGDTNTNETYVTDLKKQKYFGVVLVDGPRPKARYGQAMVLSDNLLYVVGGTSGHEYSSDIHCLDLKTNLWEEVYISKGASNLEPQGRYRHEVAFYNSRIIVFGGGTSETAFDFADLPAFNIKTRKWELIQTIGDFKSESKCSNPNYPSPRRCHGCVQIPETNDQDSEVVICGGYDGAVTFCDIWILNLRTLQWRRCKENLLYPTYFHSSSLSPNGQMFIFGGICEIKKNRYEVFVNRTNEIFSMWVVIPKLKEICWEALLHYYYENIKKCSPLKLLRIGVPTEFVERLQS